MTVEHRLHFGLADILAVSCECRNCSVRVSTPPGKLSMNGLRRCPNCNHDWLPDDTATEPGVHTHPMTRLLASLSRATSYEEQLGCRVILEFDDPCRT